MDDNLEIKPIEVVAAVIRDADGKILIAKRSSDKHQGDKWEFPGGKVEQGESRRSALSRELNEELGIEIGHSSRLISIYHEYVDKSIYLDVYEVTQWFGEASGKEGQPIEWVSPDSLKQFEFPEANAPIIEAVSLPKLIKVLKPHTDFDAFKQQVMNSLETGYSLLMYSPESEAAHEESEHLSWLLDTVAEYSAEVLLQSPPALVRSDYNLHFSAKELLHLTEKPVAKRVSASCHSPGELFKAQRLGLDFVIIEPVLTRSLATGIDALGWPKFQSLASRINIPVYAAGGLSGKDLELAREYGAQGIVSSSLPES